MDLKCGTPSGGGLGLAKASLTGESPRLRF
jgi:hypothetical protein